MLKTRIPLPGLRHLPNALSLSRALLSLGLAFAADDQGAILVLVLLCVLTDLADGLLARKLHCVTALGARLDSLGDFAFSLGLAAWFLQHRSGLILDNLALLLTVAVLRVASLAICRIKNGKAYVLHTVGNMATGLAASAGAVIIIINTIAWLPLPLLVLALASSAEELAIMIIRNKPDPDVRGLFAAVPGGRSVVPAKLLAGTRRFPRLVARGQHRAKPGR
jgi:CDP-diacylglycerol--glycerol-3-phosphate 3-phosphatidyltransferase